MPKTPGLNLPYGIDPVNPVPVDANYGPYTNTAQAIAAIPLALRYDGLTVQITGSGNYWWLAADLTDTGLIVKSAGGGGGVAPINTTYAALLTLKNTNTLDPGALYKITDRELGIYIRALSVSELDKRAVRSMLTPKFDTTIDANMWGSWISIMNDFFPITAGNYVVWGGSVWLNNNGNTGTAVDQLTLDAIEWTLIPKGVAEDQYYGIVTHNIEYDLDNDIVIKEWDQYNNVVGPITPALVTTLGYNPCDITNWLQFRDRDHVNTPGLNGFDFGVIAYNNEFIEGFYLPYIDDLSTLVGTIYNNKNFKVKGPAFIASSLLTENNNISIETTDVGYITNIFQCNIINVSGLSLETVNSIGFHISERISMSNSRIVDFVNCGDITVFNTNDGPAESPITLYGCFNCTLQNVLVGSFSTNTGIGLLNGTYGSINDVNSSRSNQMSISPTTLTISGLTTGEDNAVYQYLGIPPGLLFAGLTAFSQPIIIANSRLAEAKIVSTITGSLTAAIEFGVEDDAVAYLPSTPFATLSANPQTIHTISNILTVGKRFYLKNSGGTGQLSTGLLRVWLKMIRF